MLILILDNFAPGYEIVRVPSCPTLSFDCFFYLLFQRYLTREYIWHESIFHKALKDGIVAFCNLILEKVPVFPFSCSVLNKGNTATIFITSLVWSGPWLGIEPATSRTWSKHPTTDYRGDGIVMKLFLSSILLSRIDSTYSENLGKIYKLRTSHWISKKDCIEYHIQTIRFEDFYGQNIVDFHKN